jgi:hypothetical protein
MNIMPKKKAVVPYGYRVSSTKHPSGKFFTEYSDAYEYMQKEMKHGAREAGISEIFHSREAVQKKKRKMRDVA